MPISGLFKEFKTLYEPCDLRTYFFGVDTVHSQEFVCVFCFDLCKTLPNVNTATILYKANSVNLYNVSKHYGAENAQYQ